MGSININYEGKTESHEMEQLPESGGDTTELKAKVEELNNNLSATNINLSNEIARAKNAMKWKMVATKFGGSSNAVTIGNNNYSELYIEVYPNNSGLYTFPFYYVPTAPGAINPDVKYLTGGNSKPSTSGNLFSVYVYVKNDGINTHIWLQQCNQGDSDITAKSTIYIWGR